MRWQYDENCAGTGESFWKAVKSLIIFCVILGILLGIPAAATLLFPEQVYDLTGFATCSECRWWDDASPIVQRFWDTMVVADGTSRIALAPLVRDMQTIRREFQDIRIPNKAQDCHEKIDAAMKITIDMFLEFMADGDIQNAAQQVEEAWIQAITSFNELELGEVMYSLSR